MPLLATLALLLFLFDVAQRRLDLFREPVKKEAAEEAKQKQPAAVKPKREPAKKKTVREEPAAADVLWQQMKNKKKL